MMTLSIFSLLGDLMGAGWHLITGILDVLWRLATGSVNILFRFLSAVCDLLFWPISCGIDRMWDTAGCVGTVLGWGLALLLAACAVLTLGIAARNAYRKYRR